MPPKRLHEEKPWVRRTDVNRRSHPFLLRKKMSRVSPGRWPATETVDTARMKRSADDLYDLRRGRKRDRSHIQPIVVRVDFSLEDPDISESRSRDRRQIARRADGGNATRVSPAPSSHPACCGPHQTKFLLVSPMGLLGENEIPTWLDVVVGFNDPPRSLA